MRREANHLRLTLHRFSSGGAEQFLGAVGEEEDFGAPHKNREGDGVVQTGGSEMKFSIPKTVPLELCGGHAGKVEVDADRSR
jgi:hypothetical protein